MKQNIAPRDGEVSANHVINSALRRDILPQTRSAIHDGALALGTHEASRIRSRGLHSNEDPQDPRVVAFLFIEAGCFEVWPTPPEEVSCTMLRACSDMQSRLRGASAPCFAYPTRSSTVHSYPALNSLTPTAHFNLGSSQSFDTSPACPVVVTKVPQLQGGTCSWMLAKSNLFSAPSGLGSTQSCE